MKDFKKAPQINQIHKNLNQEDLQKALDEKFNKQDNEHAFLNIDFTNDYSLDKNQTVEKLKQAGYKVQDLQLEDWEVVQVTLK
ncbi:hypothetical protein KYI13_13035 (plasmid) [Macrococcoides bohemicum]|uniref:hypothetical protein n=1 Tax=Macrococcoides bohemicum TaxID=1903056 RepID=UPI001C5CF8F4|nr:hypothetical protein [Macrococcus bohemicus]QYA46166.1 hypothetical protein KYI13_13035 [Macrococcus bohemicus]